MRFQNKEITGPESKRLISLCSNLTPVKTGHSLHVWTEDYIIEGKRYQLWGGIGTSDFGIDEIVDLFPEDGPFDS